jgi:hypothetical protein
MPMRVQCEQCASTYTLPDSRLTPGRRVQFQCRHCHHRIVVAVPELAESGEVSTPHPSPAPTRQPQAATPAMWFVVLGDGQQRLAAEAVQAAIGAGTIGPDTLMWRKGFGEWKRAVEIPEWQQAVQLAHQHEARTATPAYNQPAELAAGAAEVAGVASIFRAHVQVPSGQNAMAMPVIRPEQLDAVPLAHETTSRPTRGLQRHEPQQRQEPAQRREGARQGARRETVGPNGNSRWSPATDTWTGPKGNVTRRVPEEQRQALLRQVAEDDAEERARAEALETEGLSVDAVRSWRFVAAAALAAALVAACVAVFAIVRWRAAETELQACRHPAVPTVASH